MGLVDRRQVLRGTGLFAAAGLATYGVAVEPFLTPRITRYALTPPGWPAELALRVGIIADIHACEPWMDAARVRDIAGMVMRLDPDLIVLLGDFNGGHRFVSAAVEPAAWAEALSILRAPLGVYSILGNHDWWHGALPGLPGGPAEVQRALSTIGIPVLENRAVKLEQGARAFWLAGLGDQMAHRFAPRGGRGADDLAGTLRQVGDTLPVLMLAHEPFVFHRMPARVALTLCGHTHGGQVNLPLVGAPLLWDSRYVYGHVIEGGRHMIIAGGLGESGLPVRIGSPPEIVELRLGGESGSMTSPRDV